MHIIEIAFWIIFAAIALWVLAGFIRFFPVGVANLGDSSGSDSTSGDSSGSDFSGGGGGSGGW